MILKIFFYQKQKPILLGVAYRPPSLMQFVEKLSNSISNSNSFDAQEVILLGDFNVNLLDRKRNLFTRKATGSQMKIITQHHHRVLYLLLIFMVGPLDNLIKRLVFILECFIGIYKKRLIA